MAIEYHAKTNSFTEAFFLKLSKEVLAKVDALTAAGATVVVQYQGIAVKPPWNGKPSMFALPWNTTAIVKGNVPAKALGALCSSLEDFFGQVGAQIADWKSTGKAPANFVTGFIDSGSEAPKPKQVTISASGSVKPSFVEDAEAPVKIPPLKIPKGPPKQVSNLIHLTDATALFQLVHGTSDGSVYKVIALGERLRMAARIKSNQISIRVEGPINASERKALVELGFTDNASYLSWHVQLGMLPPERLLGCLFFHSALKFTSKIETIEEVLGGTN